MTQINPNQINPITATDKQVIAFDQASGEFTIQDQITNHSVLLSVFPNAGDIYSLFFDGTYYYSSDGVTIYKIDNNYHVINNITPADIPNYIVLDGGYLYIANSSANKIIKIDTTTMTEVDSLTVTNPCYMTICGTYLLCSAQGNLHKIDLSTFTYITTASGIAKSSGQMAFDGVYLYTVNPTGYIINKIDISTMSVIGTASFLGANIYNLIYNNGYVCYEVGTGIARLDIATMTPLGLPGTIIQGIYAYNGNIYVLTDGLMKIDIVTGDIKGVYYIDNVSKITGLYNNKIFMKSSSSQLPTQALIFNI